MQRKEVRRVEHKDRPLNGLWFIWLAGQFIILADKGDEAACTAGERTFSGDSSGGRHLDHQSICGGNV